MSSVFGIPSMTLSPRHITPSQSKMKTSTLSRSWEDGSVNRGTLAIWREENDLERNGVVRVVNAVDLVVRSALSASLVHIMV